MPAADCKQTLLDEYCQTTASSSSILCDQSYSYARKSSLNDWTCYGDVETSAPEENSCVDNSGTIVSAGCKPGKGATCKKDSELQQIISADNCQAAANSGKWLFVINYCFINISTFPIRDD